MTATSTPAADGSSALTGIERGVRDILVEIGEDPAREGLLDTPARVARAYAELTAGYTVDTERLVNGAIFTVDYDEMVVVRDIDFYSLCEHHLLPFYGRAHVAYIPGDRSSGCPRSLASSRCSPGACRSRSG